VRLVVSKAALRRFRRWTQCVLGLVAVSMFGYCGFVLADTWMFQKRERRQLERLLAERQAATPASLRPTFPASRKTRPAPAAGGLIGRMEISRLAVSVMVMEGTSRTTLRRAAGHIPGTALPGEAGNVGISGHRDTFFRPLRNIRTDDLITLTTPAGEYRYRVISTRVVGPGDVAVLDPNGSETLTLVTCYPFYFVGSAPDRFIVRAERVI
jgi:sortase A